MKIDLLKIILTIIIVAGCVFALLAIFAQFNSFFDSLSKPPRVYIILGVSILLALVVIITKMDKEK